MGMVWAMVLLVFKLSAIPTKRHAITDVEFLLVFIKG
jgi:hypothetical protein